MKGIDVALSTYDFKKYFDAFDHDFTHEMMVHVGMPPRLAKLTLQLYKKLKRVQKGKAHSDPFSTYTGSIAELKR